MLKLLVFLAGLAGVAGFFFLPLSPAGETPYQIVITETDAAPVAEIARGLGASEEQTQRITTIANDSLLVSRGTLVALYVPAGLLALFGLLNLPRRRIGRLAGFIALLLGAANGAAFAYFYIGGKSLGYGVWMLAIAGAGGMLAGLGAMFRPADG